MPISLTTWVMMMPQCRELKVVATLVTEWRMIPCRVGLLVLVGAFGEEAMLAVSWQVCRRNPMTELGDRLV